MESKYFTEIKEKFTFSFRGEYDHLIFLKAKDGISEIIATKHPANYSHSFLISRGGLAINQDDTIEVINFSLNYTNFTFEQVLYTFSTCSKKT